MERKKSTALLVAVYFVHFGAYAVLWEFLVIYLAEIGHSATFVGGVITVTNILSILVQPLVGYISDKIGSPRRILLLFALFLVPSAYILAQTAAVPGLLVLIMGFISVFENPLGPLLDSYAVKSQDIVGISYGIVRACGPLGYAIAMIVGGKVINGLGYGVSFHIRAVLLVTMALGLLLLPDLSQNDGEKRDSREKVSIWSLFQSRAYLYALAVIAAYSVSVRVFNTYSPILIQQFGGDNGTVGMIGGVSCLLQVPFIVVAGRKVKQISAGKMYAIAFGLQILRCALVWAFPSIRSIFVGMMFYQISFAFSAVTSVQLFYRASPRNLQSTGIIVGQSLTNGIAALVGNTLGGLVTDHFSALLIVPVSGVFCVIGMALTSWGRKQEAHP